MGIAAICTVTGALLKTQPRRADEIFAPLCAVWPPRTLSLVAFKQERRLEVWADGRLLKIYPILAASGGPGPKRREGDRQVPEGIYRLTTLNPQSRFHLSVRVDYPDGEDLANGCTGKDIYVHGGAASIGCIAIGDSGIEEVYRLAQLVDDRRIFILPWDFRRRPPPETPERWVADRYARLESALNALR
jgi:hypothetical protein